LGTRLRLAKASPCHARALAPLIADPGKIEEKVGVAQVCLSEVTKAWGGEPAVNRISFAAEAGSLVVLLGPSGCGKSTTLRLIAGLENPDAGTIEIAGRDVTHAPPSRRGVAMVFQSYALFPHLSVAENILFGLRVRRVPRAQRDARLKRAAEMLGLEALLERKPAQLSGGQQQRVALGRAVVAETAVCLMDEPLSNLDAQLRGDMRREIRALQRRLGITMLYVTHDQVEAMTMADRVILMRAGHIEQNGTPAGLYEQPETAFAARFIGAPPMNLLSAGVLAKHPGLLAGMPAGHNPQSLIVGVRPEAVALAEGGLQARIIAVEYLGADTQVETRVAEEMLMVRLPGRLTVSPGASIYVKWRPQDAHWFDAPSQRRIAGK
jgi:sn-glycerol 3-phosphate transport system ATP-binding protein